MARPTEQQPAAGSTAANLAPPLTLALGTAINLWTSKRCSTKLPWSQLLRVMSTPRRSLVQAHHQPVMPWNATSLKHTHLGTLSTFASLTAAPNRSLHSSAAPGSHTAAARLPSHTHSSSSTWWDSVTPCASACISAAAAVGAVAVSGSLVTAFADKGQFKPGAGSGAGKGPLQQVVDALGQVWAEVEEDMQRINASLPSRVPQFKGQQPKAVLESGKLEVTIPVRQGADTNKVLSDMLAAFQGQGTQTAIKSHTLGTSQTVQLEVSSPASDQGPPTVLRAQLFVPPAGGKDQAEVTVQKKTVKGGQPEFTQQELEGLSRVVRSANLSMAPDASHHAPGSAAWWRSWSAETEAARRHGLESPPDVDAFMHQFQSDIIGPFFGGIIQGGLHQMMDEMERLMAGAREEQGYEGGYDSSEPTRPRSFIRYPSRDDQEASWQLPPGQQRPHAGGAAGGEEHDWGSPQAAAAVKQLRSLGAQVFPPAGKDKMDWGVLAGYEQQKRLLEDCLLLPLKRPEVYAQLAAATRATPGSNRPRAVLFEGPPGTGKTTSARVMSSQAAVPLVYLPLEAVLSKWYGESEGQLANVFKAAAALGGAIIFIDELDALGGSRDRGDMHEASRRLLSVLLREMDGFDATGSRAVVIGATNRKVDLDPALLSRFDMSILFDLPDEPCRAQILAQYAKQLSEADRKVLAAATPGMSGRDLRDVCEMSERRWASKIIREEVAQDSLPNIQEYVACAKERLQTIKQVDTGRGWAGRAFL